MSIWQIRKLRLRKAEWTSQCHTTTLWPILDVYTSHSNSNPHTHHCRALSILWTEANMLGTPHHWDLAAKFITTNFPPGSPWAAFLYFICCHWSSAIYHISPWRFLGNRCGLEFDKNVTSTHPFTLCGILTLEMQGQLGKQPTPSVLVLKFLEAPGTAWCN